MKGGNCLKNTECKEKKMLSNLVVKKEEEEPH